MKVEIILSSVLAICTAIYTIINLFLLIESRATRKQKSTPLLIAFLKSTENHLMLELHIKNIGEGVAKNVKINVLKDFNRMGKDNLTLSEIGIVKNGFNVFPPQYELKYYVHSITELYKKDADDNIILEIYYESIDCRTFKENYNLQFNQVFAQNYSNPPETFIGQIPYYLKEINNTLNKSKEQ
ncbi:hypothetical protein RDV77_04145 [Porphyromonadaceae sp. NP-X]|jgi:hypothetical protein|nr:hypothetical protein [Porphyromonadaceae sp. NP-X]